MKRGSTQEQTDAETVKKYRQYIRMELPRSALSLLEAHQALLKDIDPHSVLRDAERGIY